jgi:hypothetical protein
MNLDEWRAAMADRPADVLIADFLRALDETR